MDDFLDKITPRIREVYNIDCNTKYSIEEVDPRMLITPFRLDVIMKLYFVYCKESRLNMSYATEFFKKQVHSITGFTNKENGQEYKDGQEAFVLEFCKIIDSIKTNGFDNNQSLIPISADNVALDGAHRLACAIYFGTKVKVIRFPHISFDSEIVPCRYDYRYFVEYLLDTKYIDLAVKEYISWSPKNIYVACLWPVANDLSKREEAINLISSQYNIIYKKNCKLSFRAFCKFIAQVYMHDTWVGTIENDFSGSSSKALLTYKKHGTVSFIFFEGESKEKTLELKEEIRNIFNIEKHSIHITDNTDETKLIADIVLNKNSLEFLERSNTKKNVSLIRKLYNNPQNLIFGIEHSKGVYGLKEVSQNLIDNSLQNLKSGFAISDLIAIPETYYTYLDRKFIVPQKRILNKYMSYYDSSCLLSDNNVKVKSVFDGFIYHFCYLKMQLKKYVKLIIKRK